MLHVFLFLRISSSRIKLHNRVISAQIADIYKPPCVVNIKIPQVSCNIATLSPYIVGIRYQGNGFEARWLLKFRVRGRIVSASLLNGIANESRACLMADKRVSFMSFRVFSIFPLHATSRSTMGHFEQAGAGRRRRRRR